MKLYDLSDKDQKLMTLDFFALMGLTDLPQKDKEDLANEVATLAIQHFLGSKAENFFTEEQLNQLMEKYPLDSVEDAEAFMAEVTEAIPGGERLFIQSILETKAYMIQQQYVTKYKVYAQMYDEESDPKKKEEYQAVMDDSKLRMSVIEQGNWELLIL